LIGRFEFEIERAHHGQFEFEFERSSHGQFEFEFERTHCWNIQHHFGARLTKTITFIRFWIYTLQVNGKSDIYNFRVVLLEILIKRRLVDSEFVDTIHIVDWVHSKIQMKEGTVEVLYQNVGNHAAQYRRRCCCFFAWLFSSQKGARPIDPPWETLSTCCLRQIPEGKASSIFTSCNNSCFLIPLLKPPVL
jgi:hypothetical protein